jgi:hypothetical protein
MDNTLDLTLDALDGVESPVSDGVAGFIAGAAFGLGVVGGAVAAVMIIT